MSKLGSIMPVFSCFLFVSPQNLDEVIRSKPFFIQVTHSLHHEKVGLEDLDHVPLLASYSTLYVSHKIFPSITIDHPETLGLLE